MSGSYEAIKQLEQLSTDEVEVRLLHGGVGPIIQSDVDLAIASGATIIGFNVPTDGKAKRTAAQEDIGIHTYSIIYELIDAVKDLLSGLLAPEIIEEYVGRAEVRAVFHIQKVGPVAGCAVTDGKVLRNAMAKVTRDGEELLGKLHTLKRFKDDVREVANGYEVVSLSMGTSRSPRVISLRFMKSRRSSARSTDLRKCLCLGIPSSVRRGCPP